MKGVMTAAAWMGCLAALAPAQPMSPTPKVDTRLALAILSPTATLTVTSSAFRNGQAIPLKYSDYGEKVSPALRWEGAPASAKSFVVLAEDPDAQTPKPFVHWSLYNLPATVTQIDEGIPGMPRLPELGGAYQGRSSRGNTGYMGPRPPKGDPPHHYHFQVFALDTTLTLDPNVSREQLLTAMTGHVVAGGETVGFAIALAGVSD
jgi:Raf kinase inhibitor-like YbhB/YbcL family protein